MKLFIKIGIGLTVLGVLGLLFVHPAKPEPQPEIKLGVVCGFGSDIGGGQCQGSLSANPGKGNQTFSVPSDWNSANNTIECIGSGGTGTANASGGAGGGAYAKITNLSLTGGGSATYAIGATATTSAGGNWVETYFNSTASSSASISCAFGKLGGSGAGQGGLTANSTGTTKNAGGSQGGRGGGGAGGKNGAGANGSAGDGGIGDNGSGGAGGTVADATGPTDCSAGSNGAEYSASLGSGGGGGGGVVGDPAGCNGGNYGGGGGGAAGSSVPGNGIQGVIIITYTPSAAAAASFAPWMFQDF